MAKGEQRGNREAKKPKKEKPKAKKEKAKEPPKPVESRSEPPKTMVESPAKTMLDPPAKTIPDQPAVPSSPSLLEAMRAYRAGDLRAESQPDVKGDLRAGAGLDCR